VPVPPRLAQMLQPDIQAGLVQVRDLPDRSVIVIKGDGLFEPGSAELAGMHRALMGRIADALKPFKAPVLVTGHTDNQPIRSLRFPSNWHLSQSRAETVRGVLAEQLDPNRLRAEGRADAEAVADNANAAGRARNRRVEVTLLGADAR
jgi:type VI secretion system protein ImpK